MSKFGRLFLAAALSFVTVGSMIDTPASAMPISGIVDQHPVTAPIETVQYYPYPYAYPYGYGRPCVFPFRCGYGYGYGYGRGYYGRGYYGGGYYGRGGYGRGGFRGHR